MSCLVCNEPSTQAEAGDSYQERTCLKCGRYRVTGSVLEMLKKHGWRFDVELTRQWLKKHQSCGTIATIDARHAGNLIEV
jgi:translation initiation factor 2 beta subunit (eIF-2beta)/eIF-5